MKQPRGSSTLSSTDDRTTPLLFHQSDILSACSDNESDNMNSNSYNITISSDYDEEKYREDSANEAYMQYTRNLYDERLSAE